MPGTNRRGTRFDFLVREGPIECVDPRWEQLRCCTVTVTPRTVGPSHVANLPTLVAVFADHRVVRHEFAAQAILRDDGEWVISALTPAGLHLLSSPEDAQAFHDVVGRALEDYRRLRGEAP